MKNPVRAIARVDRQIDANLAALYMRVRCTFRDCWGAQTAWNRCPDLAARHAELYRRRGELQVERDRLAEREYRAQERRERAARRRIKTPMPHPLSYGGTIGDLERLAGVNDRSAFWMPFAKFDDGFQRGVSALHSMIAHRSVGAT
ncbi:MAG TPA: hypothetical protein VMI56_17145 [Reyranella sp.]|nr:hypothetical protein [Reyranella sp.]